MIKTLRSLARRAQGIGIGLIPESDFENTSKLFICAGNKGHADVFSLKWKSLRSSPHSSRRVYDQPRSRVKNGSSSQRSLFASANGSSDISITNSFPNLNGLRL
jgi:hypothetical protein